VDLDLPRLEYLGQSTSYRHLMLIQVDKVESVYVDLQVSHTLHSRRPDSETNVQGMQGGTSR
jgi:hypothetical protein